MVSHSVLPQNAQSAAPVARRTQVLLDRLRSRLKGFALKDRQGELVGEVRDLRLDAEVPQKFFHLVVSQPDFHQGSRLFLLHSQQLERISIPERSLFARLDEAAIRRLPDFKSSNLIAKSSEQESKFGSLSTSAPLPSLSNASSQPASASMSDLTSHSSSKNLQPVSTAIASNQPISLDQPVRQTDAIEPNVAIAAAAEQPQPQSNHQVAEVSANSSDQPLPEQTIRLLEERLVVDRSKRKAGEIIVRKVVETRMVEVPVRREKLIVEQVGSTPRQLAEIDIGSGEITGVELDSAITAASEPTVSGEFASLKTASQLLEAIAKTVRHRCKQVKVELWLEDRGIQKTYHEFPAPRVAGQVLAALGQTLAHRCRQIKLELVLTDAQIQKTYQAWFEHYRDRE